MWPFKKTITIEVNRIRNKLTAEDVKEIWIHSQEHKRLLKDMTGECGRTQRRLDAANAQLRKLGHTSPF